MVCVCGWGVGVVGEEGVQEERGHGSRDALEPEESQISHQNVSSLLVFRDFYPCRNNNFTNWSSLVIE